MKISVLQKYRITLHYGGFVSVVLVLIFGFYSYSTGSSGYSFHIHAQSCDREHQCFTLYFFVRLHDLSPGRIDIINCNNRTPCQPCRQLSLHNFHLCFCQHASGVPSCIINDVYDHKSGCCRLVVFRHS